MGLDGFWVVVHLALDAIPLLVLALALLQFILVVGLAAACFCSGVVVRVRWSLSSCFPCLSCGSVRVEISW